MALSPPPLSTTVRVVRADELDDAEKAQWKSLCAQHPDYDSALFQPEFAELVAGVRDDVRVALYSRGEQLVGVLAAHIRPDGFARPLGAPFSDYCGPIVDRDCAMSLDEMLDMAGIPAYLANSMVDPWGALAPSNKTHKADQTATDSHVIRPGELSSEEYVESRRSDHAKRFKNFRRLLNQIEREVGETRFQWGTPDRATLDQLYDWKRQQFRETGLVNLIDSTDACQILECVANSSHGFATTLWIGDKLISGHFGIRVGGAFHPWLAAFNPIYGHYSAGNLLIMRALKSFSEMGLDVYDLANGHDHYKKYFANASRPSFEVFATSPGMRGRRHRIGQKIWSVLSGSNELSTVGRLKRRLDHIAVSELGFAPRVREFGYAVLARSVLRKRR
ncbi:GNAT family N-acetyltransferase [Henriciella litoralis]|uniref:GNAT family N-acetyltransferase n=1 Tax=Henriciella litoralis TaxID=568102 RepID=UPI000A0327D3|nr:GNAT family N-acetyltransferase [Henriciella litoralis]